MSDVEITLKGQKEALRCTLKAAKAVNALAGGYQNALARLAAMDQEAYSTIVAAGLGKRPMDVEQAVYDTGLPALAQPLSTFVMMLANGGKPLDDAEENSAEGEA
jgi:hypothetical protein